MKRYLLPIIYFVIGLSATQIYSQTTLLKVDLNNGGRQEAEVNEPGFVPWPMDGSLKEITLDSIKFALMNGSVAVGWYKTAVQAPYYARLVNDGILTNDIELQITGLSKGRHNLVTFHNTFDNPATNVFCPLNIYVNNILVIDSLMPTNRVTSNDSATTAYLEFEVTNNDPVIIRFKADTTSNATTDKIPLCGFILDSSDPKMMARFEYPEDKNEHVDIDSDTLTFRWAAPAKAVSYNIYLGTNKMSVSTADTNSPLYIGNTPDTFLVMTQFYNMDSYFWRVDPIDSNGAITKGDVWYFRKRQPAFPDAGGYGKYAIGGRGGKVVYVTNLNDDGPGSFRDAVENQTGPRTIMFAVSGLITLQSRLVISDDYITVAGQTAPGKGICFRWAPIGVVGNDLIIQNLRVRVGIGITYDGMGLTGAENSIIDHCSISWSIDEAFSSRGAKNITLQRTLISEALNEAGHDHYPAGAEHGFAGSIGGDVGSFHHNLLAHCKGRNWSLAGGLDGNNFYAGKLDIFNNVVYNWGSRATDGGANEVNFVNNYYKMGASTTQNIILKAQLEGTGYGSQSYFYSGNILQNPNGAMACDGTDNTCSRTYELSNGQVLDWDVFVDKPFFPSLATINSAKDAYKNVLSDVGCNQPVLDDHDIRIINETRKGTYAYKGSLTRKAGFPDSETDVGGWECYPGYKRSPNWDSDLDGLPNWWEKAYRLDTNSVAGDFSETNADIDSNGYTNLEEYLLWMDNPHYFIQKQDSIEIDLSAYTQGYTNAPVYKITQVKNGVASLKENTSMVDFKVLTDGFAEMYFEVTDAEGSSLIKKIGFFKGQVPDDSLFTYSYQLGRDGNTIVTVDSVNTVTPPPASNIKNNGTDYKDLHIYPNPAEKNLYMEFKSEVASDLVIHIWDLSGKIMLESNYKIVPGSNTLTLNIGQLVPGMYFVNIKSEGKNETLKFNKIQ